MKTLKTFSEDSFNFFLSWQLLLESINLWAVSYLKSVKFQL